MLLWKFRTYKSHTGRNDVQQIIDDYDEYALQAFSRAVAHLAISNKSHWNEPQAKKLKNEDPLYEIRYTANNRATRALGFFAPDGCTYVIVLICFHKGRVYDPPKAFESAHKRIGHIKAGTATSAPLQIDGEDFPADEEEPDGA